MYGCFNARALGLQLTGRETLELAAQAGFDGVDLLIRDLVQAGEDLDELASRMRDLALTPGAFPLPMIWRGDLASFQADLAELPRYAEAAARLGLVRTGTWVMPETPPALGPNPDLAAVVALHHERIGAIAAILASQGIQVGLETIGARSFRTGPGVPFVTRLDELTTRLGPLEQMGPNVGVLVDSFHLYAADEAIASALAWGVERVVWVHVADLPRGASLDRLAINDADRGLPGESGAVDSKGLLEMLDAAGYRGPVTVEPLAGCRSLQALTPEGRAKTAADALRSVWTSSRPEPSIKISGAVDA